MDLTIKEHNGMTLISNEDLERLHSLKHLFKNFRDTTAYMYTQSRDGKPIANLMSKLWRVSDQILAEMKHLGK